MQTRDIRTMIHTEECWNCGRRINSRIKECENCEQENIYFKLVKNFNDA